MPAPSTLSDAQIALELSALFSLSVGVLLRAADLVRELKRRGQSVHLKSALFNDFIPRIVDGHLAAECVSALADSPRTLRIVARLPLEVQIRMANGERIPVVTDSQKPPQFMSIREAMDHGYSHVAAGNRLLSIEQQRVRLRAKAKATGKPPRERPPAAPKAPPPSEEDVERLVWKLNELLAARNLRPSPGVIVRLCLELGWRPTR